MASLARRFWLWVYPKSVLGDKYRRNAQKSVYGDDDDSVAAAADADDDDDDVVDEFNRHTFVLAGRRTRR